MMTMALRLLGFWHVKGRAGSRSRTPGALVTVTYPQSPSYAASTTGVVLCTCTSRVSSNRRLQRCSTLFPHISVTLRDSPNGLRVRLHRRAHPFGGDGTILPTKSRTLMSFACPSMHVCGARLLLVRFCNVNPCVMAPVETASCLPRGAAGLIWRRAPQLLELAPWRIYGAFRSRRHVRVWSSLRDVNQHVLSQLPVWFSAAEGRRHEMGHLQKAHAAYWRTIDLLIIALLVRIQPRSGSLLSLRRVFGKAGQASVAGRIPSSYYLLVS